jgi:hypothetical protein
MGYLHLLLAGLAFFLAFPAFGQSFYFGIKGGPTLATQQWDQSFQRDPLLRYHFIAFTESYSEEDRYALFAQLGYHLKGSSIRTYRSTIQLPDGSYRDYPARVIPFKFHNLALSLGGKQKFPLGATSKAYYMFGIRGEYTVDTNLRPAELDVRDPYYAIYPFEEFVRPWTFGAIAGAGVEFPFSELVAGLIEFTVNPDFTRQYDQPQIDNVINPNPDFGGGTITIPERQIVNVTFEMTLGVRFLRKVIYID